MASSGIVRGERPIRLRGTLIGDRETGKVLYLDAGKDFVDLLLSLLLEPLATTLSLLRKTTVAEESKQDYIGVVNLYNSVTKLNEHVLCVPKLVFTKPNGSFSSRILRRNIRSAPPKSDIFYRCSYSAEFPRRACANVISRSYNTRCPHCIIGRLTIEVTVEDDLKKAEPEVEDVLVEKDDGSCSHQSKYDGLLEPEENRETSSGYVKDAVEFTVTDHLEIFPTSTKKTLDLLKSAGVKMENLESFDITMDDEQTMKLIQAAYKGNTVLNDVFGVFFSDGVRGTAQPSEILEPSSKLRKLCPG